MHYVAVSSQRKMLGLSTACFFLLFVNRGATTAMLLNPHYCEFVYTCFPTTSLYASRQEIWVLEYRSFISVALTLIAHPFVGT